MPPHITKLTLCSHVPIDYNSIPETVEELRFISDIDRHVTTIHIYPNMLPKSLKVLMIHDLRNQYVFHEDGLPEFLERLELHCDYVLEGRITFVKELHVNNFNPLNEINKLPSSLEKLVLSRVSPYVLIQFPESFILNKPIGLDVLPNSLKELTLGESFEQPILVGSIPNSVTKLCIINWNYDKPIEAGTIPPSVQYLELMTTNLTKDQIYVPHTLQTIKSNNFIPPFFGKLERGQEEFDNFCTTYYPLTKSAIE